MQDEREKRPLGPIAKIQPMFTERPPSKTVTVRQQPLRLSMALQMVVRRNRLNDAEAASFRRCLERALREMDTHDREKCAKRLIEGGLFISILANNHLAIRAPAYSDNQRRLTRSDITLAWPRDVRPSVLSTSRFRREVAGGFGFKLVPRIMNLDLTWDECEGSRQMIGGTFSRRATNSSHRGRGVGRAI